MHVQSQNSQQAGQITEMTSSQGQGRKTRATDHQTFQEIHHGLGGSGHPNPLKPMRS